MRRKVNMNLNMIEITHVTVIILDLCLKIHFQISYILANLTNSQEKKIRGHLEN